jgi:hypothetical protein
MKRSPTKRRAHRAGRAAREAVAFRPRIELLESRLAPSITAGVTGTTLSSARVNWAGTLGAADQGYELQRSSDGTTFTPVADVSVTTTNFTDTGLAPGQYFYQVVGTHQDSSTEVSNLVSATVGQPVGVNHPDFSSFSDLHFNGSTRVTSNGTPVGIFAGQRDIGGAFPAGSATFDGTSASYTLTASGNDIWDWGDDFHYAYVPLNGDGTIEARMTSAVTQDYWTKGGVMIRASLDSGSVNSFIYDTPNTLNQRVNQQWRDTSPATTGDTGAMVHNAPAPPLWLKLNRTGNVFTGSWAPDVGGVPGTYTQMAAHTTVMPATTFIGLALTSHNNGAVATATFDHVTITGDTSGSLPSTGVLRVTDNSNGEQGSVYANQQVDVRNFTTTFTLKDTPGNGAADDVPFVLQNDPRGTSALGGGGGAAGYSGVQHSIAIKFDLYTHGTHNSSTGLFTNGQSPDSFPGQDVIMGPAPIDLRTRDPMLITLAYDGTTLSETVVDTVTNATFTHSYTIDIPGTIGSTSAYAGFSGATGGENAIQEIQNWTYQASIDTLAPPSPTNLGVQSATPDSASSDSATITWSPGSTNETGFSLQRSTDGISFAEIASLPAGTTSYTDAGLTSGTYYYKVMAFNGAGNSGFSNIDRVIIAGPGQSFTVDHGTDFTNHSDLTAYGNATFSAPNVPVGIFGTYQDVGTPGDPGTVGSTTFASGTYTLSASGSDIWNNADHFQFAYVPLTGNGEIIGRMTDTFTTADFWTKGGLMMRTDLTAGSVNEFMFETPDLAHQEPVQQWRDGANGGSADTGNHQNFITGAPVWLRLNRTGNVFRGYYAFDFGGGQHSDWIAMTGPNDPGHTTVMPATVYVGLALTAHNNGLTATVRFDNVSITGTTGTLPPPLLRLTDGGPAEAGGAFTTTRVGVANFTTTFNFQLHGGTTPSGEGIAFVLQGISPTALGPTAPGSGGQGLGAGGIPNSVAIKFDLNDNMGEGSNSTGLFLGGDLPTIAANPSDTLVDLSGSGIDLHSGDPFSVTLTYDGTMLTETITDTSTAASFTVTYAVDIVGALGGNVGYAGFTGTTSSLSTIAEVQNWSYQFTEAGFGPAPHGGSTGGHLGLVGLFGGTGIPSAVAGTQGSVPVAPAVSSGNHARGLADLLLSVPGAPADSWQGLHQSSIGVPAVDPNALDTVFAQL